MRFHVLVVGIAGGSAALMAGVAALVCGRRSATRKDCQMGGSGFCSGHTSSRADGSGDPSVVLVHLVTGIAAGKAVGHEQAAD